MEAVAFFILYQASFFR